MVWIFEKQLDDWRIGFGELVHLGWVIRELYYHTLVLPTDNPNTSTNSKANPDHNFSHNPDPNTNPNLITNP